MTRCKITEWYHDKRYSSITSRYPDRKIFPDFYKTKRQEFILRPGEMIFIPAGMFHFVFSEDPDPETGLCAAVNFWYCHSAENEEGWKGCDEGWRGWENDEGCSRGQPRIGWHNIHLKFDEICSILEKKDKLKVNSSDYGYFPPDFMKHRYPYISTHSLSFKEFCEARNPDHYMAQTKCPEIEKFAIPHIYPLKDSNIWLNWGNRYTLPHYDGMDNWLCQLKGTRRVMLIPQSQRNFLYLLNPYPLKLLNTIYGIVMKSDKNTKNINHEANRDHEANIDNDVINLDNITKFLEAIEGSDEIIITCRDLEISYGNQLQYHTEHGVSIPSHKKWRTFKIKHYQQNDVIEYENDFGVSWFIKEGSVQVGEVNFDMKPGDAISFVGNSLKVLTNCIIITPHGSDNGI
jgi:hypothetical protein